MLTNKEINEIIEGIRAGVIKLDNLPRDIYLDVFEQLEKQLIRGLQIPTIKEVAPREVLGSFLQLSGNLRRFAAHKTYQLINSMIKQSNIIDMKKKYKLYNKTWQRVENDLVVKQAMTANDWYTYDSQKDVMPYLRYVTALDERVRHSHAELHGIIKKVDSPFWDEFMPANGYNCFDDQTEIYTSKGWVKFSDLDKTENVFTLNPDTKEGEWQKPINWIKQKHDGKLVKIKANNMDIVCTHKHKTLVQKNWDNRSGRDNLVLIDAENIATGDKIYRGLKWSGTKSKSVIINGIKFTAEFYVKLMGWYLADGSTTKRNDNVYQIKISQETHKSQLIKDMQECPITWYEGKDYIGINSRKFGQYLYGFGKCNEKFVPEIIKTFSPELIKLFLDRFIICDGNISKPQLKESGYYSKPVRSYFSSSKMMIDDIGELIMKAGNYPSFYLNKSKGRKVKFKNGEYTINHNIWTVREITNLKFGINKKKHYSEIDYSGFVYCVEVPKHNTIYVRRNGKCYWSGNCRCTVEQLDIAQESKMTSQELSQHKKNVDLKFRNNPAKSGFIFKEEGKDKHPYFKVPKEAKKIIEGLI